MAGEGIPGFLGHFTRSVRETFGNKNKKKPSEVEKLREGTRKLLQAESINQATQNAYDAIKRAFKNILDIVTGVSHHDTNEKNLPATFGEKGIAIMKYDEKGVPRRVYKTDDEIAYEKRVLAELEEIARKQALKDGSRTDEIEDTGTK